MLLGMYAEETLTLKHAFTYKPFSIISVPENSSAQSLVQRTCGGHEKTPGGWSWHREKRQGKRFKYSARFSFWTHSISLTVQCVCVSAWGHSSPLGLQRRQSASPPAPPWPGSQDHLQRQGWPTQWTWKIGYCRSPLLSEKNIKLPEFPHVQLLKMAYFGSIWWCFKCRQQNCTSPHSINLNICLTLIQKMKSSLPLSCTALPSMSLWEQDTVSVLSISFTVEQMSTPKTE